MSCLRANPSKDEILLIHNIQSVISNKDLARSYNLYQIPKDLFEVLTPKPNARADGPIENCTLLLYEEQSKARLGFPIDSFFAEILAFHKLFVAQLHPNS